MGKGERRRECETLGGYQSKRGQRDHAAGDSLAQRRISEARQWVEDNPNIWADIRSWALACKQHSGRCSIYDYAQRIRWHDYADKYGRKTVVNNDWVPIFARLLVAELPELRETLEMRASRYDLLLGEGN